MTLQDLRNSIDCIDDQLLALLNERMAFVQQVGDLKRSTKALIYRPEREKYIVDRLTQANQQKKEILNQSAIEAIFLEIFAVARNIELPERIAFLGPEGSFTHQAAESRFGAMSEYLVLPTIRSIFESVETGRAKFGVVPIENNQEGMVSETIDLLCDTNLVIAAEVLMPIHFAFATTCERLQDITQIYSKDIAFRQCGKFLRDTFDPEKTVQVPVESTSKAAKLAAQNPNTAAICSPIAAKLFGVPVLFENLEDSAQNRTRFLIIAKDFENQPSGADKTTIAAILPNTDRAGVLADFLKDFKDRNINIIKIESRPLRLGADFKFWFLLEVEGHRHDPLLKNMFELHADSLRWLGSYLKVV